MQCPPLVALAAVVLLAVAAAQPLAPRESNIPTLTPARTQRFACSVTGDLQTGAQESTFGCQIDSGPNVLVQASGEAPALAAHVLLRGRLEPFDEPRNPGEPNERNIQNERGYEARISGAKILQTLPPAPLTFRIALARMHAAALRALRAHLEEPSASILAGELWGERSALPPDLRAEFQETGTVHVLVTAGLHLGVIAGLISLLLGSLHLPRAVTCVLAAAAVWGYAALSGLHLPALRAATMLTFALAARACGARAISASALAAAAIAIAIADPRAVSSSSFALSFSCVGAIVVAADSIDAALESALALPSRVREALTMTLATQLGTWPVTAATFLKFAPYAVPANFAVVPAVGATMILGLVQLIATPWPPAAIAAANLNSWLLAWMQGCVHMLSGLPAASVVMTPAPLWSIALYDGAFVAAFALWNRGARTLALALMLAGIDVVLAPPRPVDHQLRITVLDVGQADSIVIRTPLGHVLLVDGGGRLERGPQAPGDSAAERVGERVVVPFLLRQGVHELDAILLSHPHGDHAGGLAPALRKLRVDELADSGQRYGGNAYTEGLKEARARNVPLAYPRAGEEWHTDDGVLLHFIGPSLPFIQRSRNDINNNSLAFILTYRRFRMVFTGDAGAEAEHRFLHEGVDLRADVLKVGHHGSAYSSTPEFIEAVHPKYALISVGRRNLFGHPAPSTIRTLQNAGANIFRTDQNGAITIVSDGTASTVAPLMR